MQRGLASDSQAHDLALGVRNRTDDETGRAQRSTAKANTAETSTKAASAWETKPALENDRSEQAPP